MQIVGFNKYQFYELKSNVKLDLNTDIYIIII